MDQKPSNAEEICLACGLCCNGVIFADVQLQPGDSPDQLREHGFKLLSCGKRSNPVDASNPKLKFTQPCSAFNGTCRIYADRPHYCRAFECALLKGVKSGKIDLLKAQRWIQTTHKRADKVRKLLRQLGDTDETLALSKRFQRIRRKMESGPFDEEQADLFGELTLAVHDLNLLISDIFYPGR